MENIRYIQVYFVSIGMLLVLVGKIYIDKEYDTFLDRIYLAIVCSTIAVLSVEATGWLFDGVAGQNAYYVVTISDVILLILILIPGMLWMIYVNFHIYADMQRVKLLALVCTAILFYFAFLSITAPFNHFLFYIDDSHYYHHGSWYWQLISMFYLIFIYVLIILWVNRKRISRAILLPLFFFVVPPLIGTTLQMVFYGLSLAWAGISISILILYVYVQSQKIGIDHLTGLFNRRKLDLFLADQIKKQSSTKSLAVLMIDVDHFKQINDTWGHDMGDKALAHCGVILRKCFHNQDFIARYAGDDFVVVLELNNKSSITSITKRLAETVEKMGRGKDIPYNLSFSTGYALFPEDGQSDSQLIQVADQRMYQEKHQKQSA
jgi:diguanylate cyclase (GGDEF)-like protein